ncbi:SEP domain protein [Ostertagia ostertagi]
MVVLVAVEFALGENSAPIRDDGSSGESDTSEHEEVVVELFMWENGFSIDDGPLRSFDNPESQQFLQSIMQGRVPAELLAAHPRRRIDLRMQKRTGPYEPPKLKPFQVIDDESIDLKDAGLINAVVVVKLCS